MPGFHTAHRVLWQGRGRMDMPWPTNRELQHQQRSTHPVGGPVAHGVQAYTRRRYERSAASWRTQPVVLSDTLGTPEPLRWPDDWASLETPFRVDEQPLIAEVQPTIETSLVQVNVRGKSVIADTQADVMVEHPGGAGP